jgi:hypothetical protein
MHPQLTASSRGLTRAEPDDRCRGWQALPVDNISDDRAVWVSINRIGPAYHLTG